jgi:hypothetical protein
LRDSFQIISKSNVPNPINNNELFFFILNFNKPQSSIGDEVFIITDVDGRNFVGDTVVDELIDG